MPGDRNCLALSSALSSDENTARLAKTRIRDRCHSPQIIAGFTPESMGVLLGQNEDSYYILVPIELLIM
jgi:hypothetical protein